MSYRDYLSREYEKVFPVIMLWFFSCCVFLSFFKDLYVVGFKWDWFAIRALYPLLVYLNILLYRRSQFFQRHYEISSWAVILYVTLYATYFAMSNGNIESTYFLAIISVLAGLSMLPVTRETFYGILITAWGIFFGTNIFYFRPNRVEILSTILPYIPVAAFLIAIYELFLSRRKREFRIQEKLSFHLAGQNDMIMRQSKTIADSQIDIQVGRIAAQVAHDIQAPLGLILSNLDQLREEDFKLVGQAEGAALRLKAISERLLKSRSEYKSEEIVNVDIIPLIHQVLDEKREFARLCKKSIQINLNSSKTDVTALINSLDFTRVLCNVIQNSIEAIDSEGHIDLTLQTTDYEVRLAIDDSGKGIPLYITSRVFERGFTYGKTDGHGLGLSHAKEVVESWGGKISISNRKDGGTRLSLILSRKVISKPSQIEPAEYVLIDDNPLTHASWLASSEKYQIKLLTFFDPKQARDKLHLIPRQSKIYIDYTFGRGENGIALAKHFKANGFEKVFIATGMRNAEILEIEKSIPVVSKEPPWLVEKSKTYATH